jgi:hypothetical protein
VFPRWSAFLNNSRADIGIALVVRIHPLNRREKCQKSKPIVVLPSGLKKLRAASNEINPIAVIF